MNQVPSALLFVTLARMLDIKNLVVQRGNKILLNKASARIERGYRVGLVGQNGTGKTSLMQILTGQAQEDDGDIVCDIKPKDIAYLEQSLPSSKTPALEFVKSGDREWRTIQDALTKAEEEHDGIKIAECHARLQDIDGYSMDARAAIILKGLGFTNDDLKKSVGDFSGGWQMRLQLAKVLLSRAELLLLDEPTNHLDLEAVTWFEQWLLNQKASVILISHDRDFLDNVCNNILHLSHQQLRLYSGNYTDFIKQFELQLELESRQRDKIEKQRAHMQHFVDRFKAKATKAKQAQSRMKAIEKLTIAPGLQRESPFQFQFLECDTLSSPVLKIEGEAGYPDHLVLKRLNLSLTADDRIGLLGVNGAGKSTLIKTLAKGLPLLSGEVTGHTNLKIGYFSQQQLESLDYDSTPMHHLLNQHKGLGEAQARKFLGGFNFSGDRVFDKVANFSGGEKARLALALLIYHKPNLLLLDEPTNHLDIQMREALILALQNYSGPVIVVSHDRYFINSVVDNLWLIENGSVSRFAGNLEDYQKMILSEAASEQQPSKKKITSKPIKKVTSNPQHIKRLEDKIEKLEAQKQKLQEQLADSSLYEDSNKNQLRELQTQFKTTEKLLAETETEYLKNI